MVSAQIVITFHNYRPSIRPETHAKHLALSYAFDLLRVFSRYLEYISTTLCSKSSQRGMLWNVDTGTRSGTLLACKITVFEVQEPRSRIVRFRVSGPLSVNICTDATHRHKRDTEKVGPKAAETS